MRSAIRPAEKTWFNRDRDVVAHACARVSLRPFGVDIEQKKNRGKNHPRATALFGASSVLTASAQS